MSDTPGFRLLPPPPPAPRRKEARWPADDRQLALPLPLRRVIGKLKSGNPDADWVHAWPATLVTMVEVAEAALRAADDAEAQAHARAAVVAIAAYIGDTKLRFPTPERVLRLLRDHAIWRAFDGRNTHALAAEHRLPLRTVQRILTTQRRLQQARRRARAEGVR